MKTNKKIMLGLGAITAVAVPIIVVVSCGDTHYDFISLNKNPKDYMYRTYNNVEQVGVFTKDIIKFNNDNDDYGDEKTHVSDPQRYIGNMEYGYGKDIENENK